VDVPFTTVRWLQSDHNTATRYNYAACQRALKNQLPATTGDEHGERFALKSAVNGAEKIFCRKKRCNPSKYSIG
jgi:hypothetical protein